MVPALESPSILGPSATSSYELVPTCIYSGELDGLDEPRLPQRWEKITQSFNPSNPARPLSKPQPLLADRLSSTLGPDTERFLELDPASSTDALVWARELRVGQPRGSSYFSLIDIPELMRKITYRLTWGRGFDDNFYERDFGGFVYHFSYLFVQMYL